jgi:ABC transporter substrate binding protein (PQQ-dependent alcohol dehydrogenase system)
MNRVLFAAILLAFPCLAQAAPMGRQVTIGYLQIPDDARYQDREGPGETTITPPRPVAGAEMAVDEVNISGALSGRTYKLARAEADGGNGLAARVDAMASQGIHWFLVDASDDIMAKLARSPRGKDVLLFNLTASGDELRGADCQPELVNVIPSRAMLADAMAQFLLARNWLRVLVLRGPMPDDRADAAAFIHAAQRFGLKLADTRDFIVSNDPRKRAQDNFALLTGNASYDVIYVADADGAFSRSLPYSTILPRPIVGGVGLRAVAWSWTWDPYGAPQVSHRFEKRTGRKMSSYDWAAWTAVRALDDALRESHASTTQAADRYLLSSAMNLDGAKGPPLSFRSWDHQLRQPILLATADSVTATAPMPGFLHQTSVLDTLGYDQPETKCKY